MRPARRASDAGQALVEFALVLPVVLLLLLGILQVGLILIARQTVENAARIAADTYARTLSTAEADGEAARAADRLSPRLGPPAAAIAYALVGGTRADHPASALDPGTRGELIRATIRYEYPIPMGGLARFGFPTAVALTGEAVSLIDAQTPVATATGCYEVVKSFDTFGNPIDLSATVNASPAGRVRAPAGSDQVVEIVASPGQALRPYGLSDQTVKRETVRLSDAAQSVAAGDSVGWRIGQSSTVSYRYRATVTLRPARDGSCGVSDRGQEDMDDRAPRRERHG